MDRDALTGLLQRHPDLDGQAARDLALLLGAKLGHALEQLPSSPGLSPSDLLARVGRMRLVRQGDLWEVRNAGGDTVNLCRLLGFTP